jgi:pimeloyl-ACP methyl ester carboxylesterase
MPTISTPGATISYSVAGNGPAVLFIQGVGVVGNGWRPQLDGLADRYRVLAFDNRGIGASTLEDPRSVTVQAMAADALAVADAAGAESFHVVGHSVGGVVAQELALAARARVKSLTFMCTFAHGAEAAKLSAGMFVTALRTRIGTRAMRRAAFLSLVMPEALLANLNTEGRAAFAESLRPLFGRDLADQPPIVMKQLRASARYDAFARLGTLAGIPTLVLSAAHDRIARPEYGRALAAAIPGARYVEIADAAHGLPLQSPHQVNDLLVAHFAGAGG